MRAKAFAKINLSLRVLGIRADGYHELRTIFQSIALHDTITLRAARGPFVLASSDPACPADASNLVWCAAERAWAAAGKRGPLRDVAIHVTKHIPVQAGLGGGSSDAAATLKALGRLWRIERVRLRELSAALGADVPYFFEGGTVLGLDRGDRLFPLLDRPPAWVVLAVPWFGVSTADAFDWCDQRARSGGRSQPGGEFVNDLQPAVGARHPEITALVRTLVRLGAAHAAMSGSGSAVFGLFARRRDAQASAAALARRAVRVFLTRTVDRATYQKLAGK